MTQTNKRKKPSIRRLAREWALQYLYQIDVDKDVQENSQEIFWEQLSSSLTKIGPDKLRTGRNFAEKLIDGTLKNQDIIDKTIEQFSENWSLGRIAIIDCNILRICTFEIMFCEDIPEVVSINEAIEIAKFYSDAESAKFINGIADQIKKHNK